MEVSYIYIISDGKNLKVGLSVSPEKRIKQLQTGSKERLTLVKVYKLPKKEVAKLERACHKKIMTRYPKHGEWFEKPLLFDIKCIIEEICEKYIIDD